MDLVVRTHAAVSVVFDRYRRSLTLKVVLYGLVFFVLLCARRWEQLLHAQVWDEDGSRILRSLINDGPVSLLWPLNGYLVIVPRTLSFLSLAISFSQYPLISTVFAWAFTIATLLAIAVSPVVLRGGFLLALVVMLVPSDPEVFGLPLYTFWWAGLLIAAAALWRPGAGRTWWRVVFVVVGGLSSPIILLALPLFLFRTIAARRDVAERTVAVVATLCAALQVAALAQSHVVAQKSLLSASSAQAALPVFLGNYLVGSFGRGHPLFSTALDWAAVIATFALVACGLRSGKRHIVLLIALLYLLFGSIGLSAARASILALDPISAGPRYFFYPFVFEGWLLMQIAFLARRKIVRSVAAAFLIIAALNALPALSRSQDDLDWQANIDRCDVAGDAEAYNLPVEFDGHAASAWTLPLTGAQCRALAARDWAARFGPPHRLPSMRAYTAREVPAGDVAPSFVAAAGTVVSNGWNGTDYQHSRLPGLIVIGSYRSSDADTGVLTLHLHRGERVLYRSPAARRQTIIIQGAAPTDFDTTLPTAPNWTVLDFSNPRLPNEFLVAFKDEGTGWGEWSAVALAAR